MTSDGTSVTCTEFNATRLAAPRGFYRVVMPVIPDAAGAGTASAALKAAALAADPLCAQKLK